MVGVGLVLGLRSAMLVAALALRVAARGARRLPCAGFSPRALASKALGPEREMEALTHFCRGVRGMLVENAEATGGNPQTAADVLDVAACVPRLQALRDEGAKFLLGLDDKPHPLWAAPFLSAAFEFEMMQAITTGAPPAVPAALTELTEASAERPSRFSRALLSAMSTPRTEAREERPSRLVRASLSRMSRPPHLAREENALRVVNAWFSARRTP